MHGAAQPAPSSPSRGQCCDENGDGVMAIEEVLKFVHTSKEDLLEATQFTEELVRTLDRVCQVRRCALLRLGHNGNVFSQDGDGNISRDEFSKVVGEQPILYVSAATPAQHTHQPCSHWHDWQVRSLCGLCVAMSAETGASVATVHAGRWLVHAEVSQGHLVPLPSCWRRRVLGWNRHDLAEVPEVYGTCCGMITPRYHHTGRY